MKTMEEIRQNQRAIRETRQITNAMYLLSSSRMKRSMKNIGHNQLYLRRMRAAVKDILDKTHTTLNHRYTELELHGKAAFLVIASDKGMCGAYNDNIVELALEKCAAYTHPYIETVGICTAKGLREHGAEVKKEWMGAAQWPSLYFARQIGEELLALFETDDIDEIYVVYTHYYNQLKQEPRVVRLLPIKKEDFSDEALEYTYDADILYQPSVSAVFDSLVPQYIIGIIYSCLNEATASEHVIRMNAMQSATKGADEMLKNLDFEYSMARQLAITNEITEISSAAAALEEENK